MTDDASKNNLLSGVCIGARDRAIPATSLQWRIQGESRFLPSDGQDGWEHFTWWTV